MHKFVTVFFGIAVIVMWNIDGAHLSKLDAIVEAQQSSNERLLGLYHNSLLVANGKISKLDERLKVLEHNLAVLRGQVEFQNKLIFDAFADLQKIEARVSKLEKCQR